MRDLFVVILSVLLVPLATPAGAAAADTADNVTVRQFGERFRQNLERWRQMTPEERQRLRERHARWMSMSSEERQRIRENFERFKKMHQERRQALLRAGRMMDDLQPQAREELRHRMERLRGMSPELREQRMHRLMTIRELLKEDYEQMRGLPPHSPEARQLLVQLMMAGRALHRVAPAQLEELKNLPQEQRREAVRKLVESMKGELGPPGEGPGEHWPHGGPPGPRDRNGPGPHHPRRIPPPERPEQDTAPPEPKEQT